MFTIPRPAARLAAHLAARLTAGALAAALALCLALPASAQPDAAQSATIPSETAAPAASAPPPAKPALWKVADEDTTIYLFGTVHILPAGLDWFTGEVADAFARSGELVTEIAGNDPVEMQALVMDKAVLGDDETLRALLPEADRAAYEKALAQLGVPPEAFDRFELWYAAIGISTLPLMQEGFKGENGVEDILQARAAARNVPQTALETAKYQLELFDSLPLDVQRRYLVEIVGQLPRIRSDLKAMVEAWRTGDAEELARLMNAEETDPVLVERLLVSRNKTWAKWVSERLDRPGTVFMAVGAGHLAGVGSLQEQLAADGIASERVQ